MRYLAETSSSGVGMQSTVGVENEDVALKEGNGWDIPKIESRQKQEPVCKGRRRRSLVQVDRSADVGGLRNVEKGRPWGG